MYIYVYVYAYIYIYFLHIYTYVYMFIFPPLVGGFFMGVCLLIVSFFFLSSSSFASPTNRNDALEQDSKRAFSPVLLLNFHNVVVAPGMSSGFPFPPFYFVFFRPLPTSPGFETHLFPISRVAFIIFVSFFCGNIGLFRRDIGLFCRDIGLFCEYDVIHSQVSFRVLP